MRATPMIDLTRSFMERNIEHGVKEQAVKFGEFMELSKQEHFTKIIEIKFGSERGPFYTLISNNCSERHKAILGDFICFVERNERALASSEFLKDLESLSPSLLPTEPIWLFEGTGFSIIIPNYTALSFNLLNLGDL